MIVVKSTAGQKSEVWGESGTVLNADIGGMVKLIEQSGAFDDCIREAHHLVDGAWKAVDSVVPDSFAKVCMRAFGWFVCRVRDY